MEDSFSDSDRAPSPDSQCTICLGRLQSKSFSDSCLHNFCFQCLLQWSKVKAECPLCKQPFKSIIYNVRSTVDYDQYHVPEPPRPPSLLFSDMMSYRIMFRVVNSSISDNLTVTTTTNHHIRPSARRTGPQAYLRSRLRSPSEVRMRDRTAHWLTLIYQENRRVLPFSDPGRPSNEINPEFFSSNPHSIDRLRPWVERELSIFVPYNQTMARLFLNLLLLHSIDSQQIRHLLRRGLGEHVENFLHEFRAFASSYYDMAGFDENAEYPRVAQHRMLRPPRFVHIPTPDPALYMHDSDIEVVEYLPEATTVVISDSDDSDIQFVAAKRPVTQVTLLSSDDERQPSSTRRSETRSARHPLPVSVPEDGRSARSRRLSSKKRRRTEQHSSSSDSDSWTCSFKARLKRKNKKLSKRKSRKEESKSKKHSKKRRIAPSDSDSSSTEQNVSFNVENDRYRNPAHAAGTSSEGPSSSSSYSTNHKSYYKKDIGKPTSPVERFKNIFKTRSPYLKTLKLNYSSSSDDETLASVACRTKTGSSSCKTNTLSSLGHSSD